MVDRDGDRLAHLPLARQVQALESIVRSNTVIARLLDGLPALNLGSWYIGAGGVAGTVGTTCTALRLTHGIRDYDIVYFDAADLGEPAEKAVEAQVTELLGAPGAVVDVTNEARVHTWYEQRFGRPLRPHRSVEHAIATWPTTASSIGVRCDGGEFVVCAPFGACGPVRDGRPGQHDARRRVGLSSQGRALVPDLAAGDGAPLAFVLIDHLA